MTESDWWAELVKSNRPITIADLLRHAAEDPALEDGAFGALVNITDEMRAERGEEVITDVETLL